MKLVIFDWAGTTLDYGCYAPAVVFIEVFKRRGVEITMEQARRPMGLKKVDHIRAISQQDEVAALWKQVNGKACTEADVQDMFEKDFVPLQVACIADYSELIPGTVDVVNGLKKRGIIIGSTSGYFTEAMEINFREAIRIINDLEYGNGASIYTQNGYYARKFKLETECGMIGVNVGIPAPVAYLPFGGMKASQFADIKAQGREIINFFTEDKIITERYWPESGEIT